MTVSEFVSKLAAAAPCIEELQKIGLSETEAMAFRKSSFCEPRDVPLGIPEANELFTLMNLWDLSAIEIGMVSLASAPAETPEGVRVGCVEADPLGMHADGELVVYEMGVPGHMLWPVAQSPNTFLKALAVAASFLGDRVVGKIDFEDFDAARNAARQCAALAGGERYDDFYSMLLGAVE
jgi:hypothetical protein